MSYLSLPKCTEILPSLILTTLYINMKYFYQWILHRVEWTAHSVECLIKTRDFNLKEYNLVYFNFSVKTKPKHLFVADILLLIVFFSNTNCNIFNIRKKFLN